MTGAAFLIHGGDLPAATAFHGYFFHGPDVVFGEQGLAAFRSATGQAVPRRADGCYMLVEREGDALRISADYNGYCKIFYSWQDGAWAVSNSLARLAAHLAAEGRPPRPDPVQMAAAATEGTFFPTGRGSFFCQPAGFDTVIAGVRLAPAHRALVIGRQGARLEPLPEPPPSGDYRARLGRFLGLWQARIRAIAADPEARLSCDLSGGLDSRAVFALILSGPAQALAAAQRLQIRSNQGPRAGRDLAVAQAVAGHFGLALNRKLVPEPPRLSGEASFRIWREICMGSYFPVYFPRTFADPRAVHFDGGGGENLRPFYGKFLTAPPPGRFVARRSGALARPDAREPFARGLAQALAEIAVDPRAAGDPLAQHYIHFRNRFHAGRAPQYGVTVPVLASRLLAEAAAAAGPERFARAQMHYDIYASLAPDLLDLAFDARGKRPGRQVRAALTRAEPEAHGTGRLFAGPSPKARPGSGRALDHFAAEFAEVARSRLADDLLGPAYLRRARRGLAAAVEAGGFPGTIVSKRAGVVMSLGLFTGPGGC